MEVIDKKSYSLYPVTRNSLGGIRAEYEQIPITFKTHIVSPIPIPDQEIVMSSTIKYNVYELDEFPTDQELQYDTTEEMIAKLEEWGFDWQDFAEKICFFPKNSDSNDGFSKLAKGWAKDISPCWDAWDALGLGRSFRAQAGLVELSCDDQYFGLEDYLLNSMNDCYSLKNIHVAIPGLCKYGLSNKALDETKYIWLGTSLMKTSATTPSAADIFTEAIHGTCPDFGSARSGSGTGNTMPGFFTGLTPFSPYRGYEGFAVPILFKVKTPNLTEDHVYGLIYFGYVERSYEGTISNQKYFISTKAWSGYQASQLSGYYYTGTSSAQSMTTTIDEFFDNASEWTGDFDDIAILPGIGTPTNPYVNLKNNDAPAVVGGEYDLENHIYDIDDTPNTSYEQFIASTSFFGSYKLTLQNLKNYAESLKLLYDHSTDIAIGSAYSGYANRITEGTVSLFMIPFSNWSNEDYQSNVFAVGGSGIKSTSASWSDYIWGRDGAFDSADLLNTYTKRWTVNLEPIIRKYDNFLDFAPYSKASIFIPYVGQFELPINLIQSGKYDTRKIGLRVKFGLNVSNGDVIAIFEAEIKNSSNQWSYTPLATWTGNCARSIKLAINDDSQAIREGVRAITSMVTFAASSGASAGFMASQSGGVSNTSSGSKFNITHSSSVSESGTKSSGDTGSIGFSGNASSAMPNSIAPGQHLIGGATTAGELGWLGVQQIVVKVERPIWWMPADYADLFGYPTKRFATLRNIHGFATVSRIHLRCSATGPEKEEIERLFAEGVIF